MTGTGYGQSVQKLFYLPEAHTDFIFAIIGEEFGFVGGLLLLLCFFSSSGVACWQLFAVMSPSGLCSEWALLP